jgi:hypothetical protein
VTVGTLLHRDFDDAIDVVGGRAVLRLVAGRPARLLGMFHMMSPREAGRLPVPLTLQLVELFLQLG